MSDEEENPQPKVLTAKVQQQVLAANISDTLKGLELAGVGFETGDQSKVEQGLKVLEPMLQTFEDNRTLLTAVDWASTGLNFLGIGGNITKALSNLNEFTTSDGLADRIAEFREERVQELAQRNEGQTNGAEITDAPTIDAPPAAGTKPVERGKGNALA